MDRINRSFIRVREWQKGQTMTEYVLIVSALAEVVFVAYRSLGADFKAESVSSPSVVRPRVFSGSPNLASFLARVRSI
jgi:hypothetical protein